MDRHLFLIPCCTTKAPGGSDLPWPGPHSILHRLGSKEAKALKELRRGLAKALQWDRSTKVVAGEDLGFHGKTPPLLPAHQRFRGLLYREVPAELWGRVAAAPNIEVLVVSSLYGLLDLREPVRDYDVHMDGPVGDDGLVRDWWSRGGLPAILGDYIATGGFIKVQNYLSGNYDAAAGHIEKIVPEGVEHVRPRVKAPPMQANRYRGRELVKVLGGLLP